MDEAAVGRPSRRARASPVAERDRALALVSHELRTPLTVINGMSAVLQREERAAARAGDTGRAQALADIVEAGKRIERMVQNVLLLVTSAGEPFEAEPINVRDSLDRAITTHRRDFP